MFGYRGRIIYIDVTERSFRVEPFDEAFAKAYLGGKGFGAKILYKALRPGIDPFDPSNTVLFAVGPVTDTAIPTPRPLSLKDDTNICVAILQYP